MFLQQPRMAFHVFNLKAPQVLLQAQKGRCEGKGIQLIDQSKISPLNPSHRTFFFFFFKKAFRQGGRFKVRCCSNLSLGYSVSCHAGVVFVVTPGRPQEQSSCHHLQREGDEGKVEGPAQRALHPIWRWGILVEQIQPSQETADGAQRTQT